MQTIDKNGKYIKTGDIVLVFGEEITKCEGKELLTKQGSYYSIERVSDEDCVLESEDLEVLNVSSETFYEINEQELQEKLRYDMLKRAVEEVV
jgi:hypothetical protein